MVSGDGRYYSKDAIQVLLIKFFLCNSLFWIFVFLNTINNIKMFSTFSQMHKGHSEMQSFFFMFLLRPDA